MLVAGEPSGDALGAELVRALRRQIAGDTAAPNAWNRRDPVFEPRFFGAGGPQMRESGVDLQVDMMAHSAIGISDVLVKLLTFRRLFKQLSALAGERLPDAIICVDFSGFNRRLGHAIKHLASQRAKRLFNNWSPKLIQYVSPQVWASRPGRAIKMRQDFDLVLSIFPFEKDWYLKHAPGLKVEFVGHPIVERYPTVQVRPANTISQEKPARILLLPGSRRAELKRHIPPLTGAMHIIRSRFPQAEAVMALPNAGLASMAKVLGLPEATHISIGNVPEELAKADLALASTGTVTMECAWFGVPTVAFYRTSWSTYQIGRRIVTVKYLAMPNILADAEIFPEFVQEKATAENIGNCAADLLSQTGRRLEIQQKLSRIATSLGEKGASDRAARAILRLWD